MGRTSPQGCELPQFGRIVLQPVAGDSGDKVYMPTFMLSARAVERHGLKQQKAALVATKRMHVAKLNHAAIAEACRMPREQVQETIKQLLWCPGWAARTFPLPESLVLVLSGGLYEGCMRE